MFPTKKGKKVLGRFRVPYRIYGNKGPFIACVNGAQQTMASWFSVVPKLSGSSRIMLYDAPGQAKDTILSGGVGVSVEEQVTVLHELIQKLGADQEPICLLGASWGAAISAIYAARWPDRVACLLLASFGLRPSPKMLEVIEEAKRFYAVHKKREGAELIIKTFGQRLKDTNKIKMLKQFESLSDEQFESVYEHIKTIETSGHLSDHADLSKVTARTIIINGEADELLDHSDVETASRLIPQAEIRMIPNVGHFLHLEREDILDIYAEYLGEKSSRS